MHSLQSDYSVADSENVLIYNADVSGLGTVTRAHVQRHHIPVDMAISNFSIKFEHEGKLRPGDEIKGQVIMDVWSTIVIRYVEFNITGKGISTIYIVNQLFYSIDQCRPFY